MCNKKILIVGDSCQDMFEYGICERLCPEAPVPIFKSKRVVGNGGMAINVMENLKALGIDCDMVTNDIRPVKTRYIDEISNQMLLRIDMKDEILENVSDRLKEIDFSKYDAVVISDYDKGYISEEDIEYITNNHNLVFLDSKKKFGDWSKGVEFIKINGKEFYENSDYLTLNYEGELIITLGKEGARHWFTDYPIEIEHEVRDLSGAGDTFFAAFVAEYLKNNDICTAIKFANRCASWVVTQKGVAVIDKTKI